MRYRHVALYVGPRFQEAEEYYAALLGMEVVLREGIAADGEWSQLRPELGWEDVAESRIGMVALQRGDVILPLFADEPSGERFYAIGLVVGEDEIAGVAARLSEEERGGSSAEHWLAFVDRYGLRWQLSTTAPFRGAGARGRWLEA